MTKETRISRDHYISNMPQATENSPLQYYSAVSDTNVWVLKCARVLLSDNNNPVAPSIDFDQLLHT